MKVLFVGSGNIKEGISPISYNQGLSLKNLGIEVDFFTIKGKGFRSYFRHIFILRTFLKGKHYDIIHAHYSLTSYVASLSGAKPLVVSLMGSDVIASRFSKPIIWFFYKFFWKQIIVKSKEMEQFLGLKNIEIIPNGVDLEKFQALDKGKCQQTLDWKPEKIHILFAAGPHQPEKNYFLTQQAVDLINSEYNIVMHYLADISHTDIPTYLIAADIMILSSLHEGSPNVIKEAMACNCPIVATNVGDIKWVFGDTDGCFLTSFEVENVVEKLIKAIEFVRTKGRTNGRKRIIKIGLDSTTIAKKIIEVYKNVEN